MTEFLIGLHPDGAREGAPDWHRLFRHAIRDGLIPVITIFGLQLGALLGGAVGTEQIFVVPGSGRLLLEAVFCGLLAPLVADLDSFASSSASGGSGAMVFAEPELIPSPPGDHSEHVAA